MLVHACSDPQQDYFCSLSLYLMLGIPRLPQTMLDVYYYAESNSVLPLIPAFKPSVSLCSLHCPAAHRCIALLPSLLEIYKRKLMKKHFSAGESFGLKKILKHCLFFFLQFKQPTLLQRSLMTPLLISCHCFFC